MVNCTYEFLTNIVYVTVAVAINALAILFTEFICSSYAFKIYHYPVGNL